MRYLSAARSRPLYYPARIGRAMKEHDFVGQNGAGKSRDIPLEERMYPDMKV